jgi:hypothetical protein
VTQHETETDTRAELFPIDPEDVLKHWVPKIIPALTVHISGKTEFIVMLPCLNTDSFMPKPVEQQDARTVLDASHLAKVLTDRTYEMLEWAGTKAVWTTDTERHKKDELTVNGYKFIITECESDRPAFVIRNANGKEAHHCYWAMGLSHQHGAQLVLLARIYDVDVLATYLLAVTTNLGINLYTHNLTVFREPRDAHVQTETLVKRKLTEMRVVLHDATEARHQTPTVRGPANEISFETIPRNILKWSEWSRALRGLMTFAMGIERPHVTHLSKAWSKLRASLGIERNLARLCLQLSNFENSTETRITFWTLVRKSVV